jgi:UDPglucose--hexose-1-phosphate uridylyltransferase
MTADATPLLRHDVATNDWVLFAPARARRPHPHDTKSSRNTSGDRCPFCPGNEHLTPDEILRVDDGRGAWSVRVVPNKFPALRASVPPEQVEIGPVFRQMGGYGVHEVVIESPEHSRSLPHQPLEQIERVLRVLRDRFVVLSADPQLRAIVVFKNHGEGAGTSLAHPHWQIIATPVVPRLLRQKHEIATDYFDRTAKCLYCVMLDEELKAVTRVIAANDEYVAVLPFASHVPYQVRVLPRTHRSSFGDVPSGELRSLAVILQTVLARIDAALGDPDFNLTVDTAPIGDERKRYFLWHIDVLPRVATPAGFELGSGMSINPVLPEDAATTLRARLPDGEQQ